MIFQQVRPWRGGCSVDHGKIFHALRACLGLQKRRIETGLLGDAREQGRAEGQAPMVRALVASGLGTTQPSQTTDLSLEQLERLTK